MIESTTLTDRILDQVVEQIQDHQQLLADFSARLETRATDLIENWTRAYRTLAALEPLPPEVIAHGSQEDVAQPFFSELESGNLRQAFSILASWAQVLVYTGLSYDLALRLFREYQRAVMVNALEIYSQDPQLPLALDACDDLFEAAIVILSATYVQAGQKPPAQPAPPEIAPRYVDSAHLGVLGQLTGGMTHGLNNLLASLIGRAQLLQERVDDLEVRDELQEIQNTAAFGTRMVRRVQDYARSERGERKITDVNLLLREASEITRFMWRDQAEAKGTVIDVVRDFADVPSVRAHPAQLRQVFVAVILNAIEACPNGGVITLRTEWQDKSVLVSIADNGQGMSDTIRTDAGKPFFTTKESPHLGLGLSTALQIVTEHDGSLEVDSEPRRGTTVNIFLPVAQVTPPVKGDKTLTSPRPANVLVIDNELSVRTLLARVLSIQGHNTVTAESGAEGIAAFKRDRFDIVLTDLGMPEMSGWDVAREIKKLNYKALVALTTGWPIEYSAAELKLKGIDRVVSKPFDLPLLYALVEDALVLRDKE